MSVDPRLESYLATLDRALGQIPVSDRADIVTEIKSHVLDALEKDPQGNLSSILASLGEPEAVANRYLLERGLKPGKPPRSPMVKWLTLGFLGTLGLFLFSGLVLVWRFSPVVSIDDEAERVTILGGLIDIDGKAGRIRVGSTTVRSDEDARTFEGSRPALKKAYGTLAIPFSNGKLSLRPSVDDSLRWRCRFQGAVDSAYPEEAKGKFTLHLEDTAGAKCDIEIPEGVRTVVNGNNGSLEVEKPRGEMDIELDNGKVSLEPDGRRRYRYDLRVSNGVTHDFPSSQEPGAIPIRIAVANGAIKRH